MAAMADKMIINKALLFARFLAASTAIFFLLVSLSVFINGTKTSCVSSIELASSLKKYFLFNTSTPGFIFSSISITAYFERYPSSVINLSSTNTFTGFSIFFNSSSFLFTALLLSIKASL